MSISANRITGARTLGGERAPTAIPGFILLLTLLLNWRRVFMQPSEMSLRILWLSYQNTRASAPSCLELPMVFQLPAKKTNEKKLGT